MRWLFGGKLISTAETKPMIDETNMDCSITRLIGESFRLHAQALIGYIDDVEATSNVSTPSMTSQGADEDSVY